MVVMIVIHCCVGDIHFVQSDFELVTVSLALFGQVP